MRFIWATRGRTWGFRFLRSGGFADPLAEYETYFSRISDEPEGWLREGDNVAARFSDPELRCDSAGRIIPHEFLILGRDADGIESVASARERIWPRVAEEFARIWDVTEPPDMSE